MAINIRRGDEVIFENNIEMDFIYDVVDFAKHNHDFMFCKQNIYC
jgi:hypothetical protein